MSADRDALLDWASQGLINDRQLREAAAIAGVIPDAANWRKFTERLLAWAGIAFLCAGLIFFLAYNWQALGRYSKFAIAETAVVAMLITLWRTGVDRQSGKVALVGAVLSVGALLALIGQTYQTGADTYELFASWAIVVLPWVMIARFSALWLLWIGIVNAAAYCYYATFNLWGMVTSFDRSFWAVFGVNVIALVTWESLARAGVGWLRERWSPRILSLGCFASITLLAIYQIFEPQHAFWPVPIWATILVAAYVVYRRSIRDLFVLASSVLSLIAVIASVLAHHMLAGRAGAEVYLFIGVVVIGLSAAGSWWLRQVANEKPV